MAATIGRQALEEYGYEEIIRRAVEAHFLRYPEPAKPNAGNLVGQTLAEAAKQAWPVFTQWAVMAGITSQLDSPAPGPADIVAIGEIVVGLYRAGKVAAMVLNMSADNAGSTTTTVPTTSVPTMPTTLSLTDQELWRFCNQQHNMYKATQKEVGSRSSSMKPLKNAIMNSRASAQDRATYCSQLDELIKLAQRLKDERSLYVQRDCDRFDWFNEGTTAAERLAKHQGQLSEVVSQLGNLKDLKNQVCK